jgi:16S rRNA (cytidine1402-2'-O)-methyltransferase
MPGRLVLAGTPIGRPDDASTRLARVLASADVVAAEDTRRLQRLASDLGISIAGRVLSFFEGNERERVPELIEALRGGANVVLVSDAGMPSVSDPGYRLVEACVAADIDVTVVPGPSAVLAALAVSGLPVDRFCFEGFLPRKAGERARALAALASEPRTIVFFEAPHRLAETLGAMAEAFGSERRTAVCRELTKTYEEVHRGTLDECLRWAQRDVRGEVTLVVEGAAPIDPASLDPMTLAAQVGELEASGLTRKEAIAEVVDRTGARKRAVFDAVVAAKSSTQTRPRPAQGLRASD